MFSYRPRKDVIHGSSHGQFKERMMYYMQMYVFKCTCKLKPLIAIDKNIKAVRNRRQIV